MSLPGGSPEQGQSALTLTMVDTKSSTSTVTWSTMIPSSRSSILAVVEGRAAGTGVMLSLSVCLSVRGQRDRSALPRPARGMLLGHCPGSLRGEGSEPSARSPISPGVPRDLPPSLFSLSHEGGSSQFPSPGIFKGGRSPRGLPQPLSPGGWDPPPQRESAPTPVPARGTQGLPRGKRGGGAVPTPHASSAGHFAGPRPRANFTGLICPGDPRGGGGEQGASAPAPFTPPGYLGPSSPGVPLAISPQIPRQSLSWTLSRAGGAFPSPSPPREEGKGLPWTLSSESSQSGAAPPLSLGCEPPAGVPSPCPPLCPFPRGCLGCPQPVSPAVPVPPGPYSHPGGAERSALVAAERARSGAGGGAVKFPL